MVRRAQRVLKAPATERLALYFTDDELGWLKEFAGFRGGLRLGTLVRELVLSGIPQVQVPAANDACCQELARTASNLTQLQRHVAQYATGGQATDFLLDELQQCSDLLHYVRSALAGKT